jgi:hypothetical protein
MLDIDQSILAVLQPAAFEVWIKWSDVKSTISASQWSSRVELLFEEVLTRERLKMIESNKVSTPLSFRSPFPSPKKNPPHLQTTIFPVLPHLRYPSPDSDHTQATCYKSTMRYDSLTSTSPMYAEMLARLQASSHTSHELMMQIKSKLGYLWTARDLKVSPAQAISLGMDEKTAHNYSHYFLVEYIAPDGEIIGFGLDTKKKVANQKASINSVARLTCLSEDVKMYIDAKLDKPKTSSLIII